MNNYVKIGNIYKVDDSVIDFKSYKNAKINLEHLKSIAKIVDLSIKSLSHYEIYGTAYECLGVLKYQQTIINGQISRCEKILKKKEKK